MHFYYNLIFADKARAFQFSIGLLLEHYKNIWEPVLYNFLYMYTCTSTIV